MIVDLRYWDKLLFFQNRDILYTYSSIFSAFMKKKQAKSWSQTKFNHNFFNKFEGKIAFVSRAGLESILLPKIPNKPISTLTLSSKGSFSYGKRLNKTDQSLSREKRKPPQKQQLKLPKIHNAEKQNVISFGDRQKLRL